MERLTKDDVKEMGMVDLAHNQVFIKNGEAWFRDFEREISARDLAKEMFDFHGIKHSSNIDEFDEDMMYFLEDGYETITAIIALFYRALWSMADVREKLKAYEDIGLEPEEVYKTIKSGVPEWIPKYLEYRDLEKQGRLIKLPCKVGDTVYLLSSPINVTNYEEEYNEGDILIFECKVSSITKYSNEEIQIRLYWKNEFVGWYLTPKHFGKVVFLTREEAEKALEGLNNEN